MNQVLNQVPLFAAKHFVSKFAAQWVAPSAADTNNEFDQHMAAGNAKQNAPQTPAALAQAAPGDPARINAAADALRFLLAGNAIFTLRSTATGTRYTFQVQMVQNDISKPPVWFVRFLAGPDNTNDYQYLGMIRGGQFRLTAKSHLKSDSLPVKAFDWALRKFQANQFPQQLEMWHEGRCGRCGRRLTVPSSIANGLGPECAAKGGF